MITLEERITALEDIEKIKLLQHTYGYYMDNRRYDDVIDLFSENAEGIESDDTGFFIGKAGIKRFYKGCEKPVKNMKNWLGIHLQLQGVVHLDPIGAKAFGRWQFLMLGNSPSLDPQEIQAIWGAGVYENEYIKEDGIWRFKKIVLNHYFMTTFDEGWAKIPVAKFGGPSFDIVADVPNTEDKSYPSGYVVPYHFKNPVTEK